MSAHIERTIVPKNTDPARTHLNRELIMFPDGVCNRTLAIRHRLDTAGLKRKIGKNQVQAIRIVLSGTHEDMARMEDEGRLGEWCDDSVVWLRETYGAENLVSAVLHMDEETPHIHATVVPIVQGEDIQANIATLLSRETEASRIIAEAEQAKQELARIKAETKTVELKNSAARTATAALNGIGSLLGSNKMSRLESENRQLHDEVAELKENIGQMRTDMQNMKDSHTAERLRASEQHQREIGNLRRIVDKAKEWFPMLAEFLKIERLCRSVGLSEKYTDELLQGKVLVVTGKLRSEEYRRSFAAEKVRLQVGRTEKEGKTILDLLVDRVPIAAWFKGQWEKIRQTSILSSKENRSKGVRL